MNHSITIRECSHSELPEALVVLKMAFDTVRSIYHPTGKIAEGQAERAREGTRLIALINQQIAGTVQLANHQNHAHLIGLAVHPAFRQQGIARQLIQHSLQYARKWDHDTIVLETIKETGNIPIFEKLGFQACHERITENFVSMQFERLHEVRMELWLEPV